MTTVAYQGEPGAFGEEAIIGYFGADAVEPCPMSTFSAVCDAVEFGTADAGVLPLENSLAGTVGDALDALAEGSLTVVGELLPPIRHQLLVLPGVDLDDVEWVASHWQALSQCERFLARARLGGRAGRRHCGCGARAGARATAHAAAIASERAAERYGLEIAARDIQDSPHNVTRFAVLAALREPSLPPPVGALAPTVGWRPRDPHHVRDRPPSRRPVSRALGAGRRRDQPIADRVPAVGRADRGAIGSWSRSRGDAATEPCARALVATAGPHHVDAGARLVRRRLTYGPPLATAATAARSPRR